MVSAQPNKNIQEKLVKNLMELPNQAVNLIYFLIYINLFTKNNVKHMHWIFFLLINIFYFYINIIMSKINLLYTYIY